LIVQKSKDTDIFNSFCKLIEAVFHFTKISNEHFGNIKNYVADT